MPYDYDNRTATEKESARLIKLAEELDKLAERAREIADELAFTPAAKKLVPKDFRNLYDEKKAARELESAAVKLGSASAEARGGARVIEPYED